MSSPSGNGFHLFIFLFFSTSGALKGGPYGTWGSPDEPLPPFNTNDLGGMAEGVLEGVPKGMPQGFRELSLQFLCHTRYSLLYNRLHLV